MRLFKSLIVVLLAFAAVLAAAATWSQNKNYWYEPLTVTPVDTTINTDTVVLLSNLSSDVGGINGDIILSRGAITVLGDGAADSASADSSNVFIVVAQSLTNSGTRGATYLVDTISSAVAQEDIYIPRVGHNMRVFLATYWAADTVKIPAMNIQYRKVSEVGRAR